MSARTVRVELGARSYDILIGPSLIAQAGREIAERLPGARLAVVTDETVAALHLPALRAALAKAAGRKVIPPGNPPPDLGDPPF